MRLTDINTVRGLVDQREKYKTWVNRIRDGASCQVHIGNGVIYLPQQELDNTVVAMLDAMIANTEQKLIDLGVEI